MRVISSLTAKQTRKQALKCWFFSKAPIPFHAFKINYALLSQSVSTCGQCSTLRFAWWSVCINRKKVLTEVSLCWSITYHCLSEEKVNITFKCGKYHLSIRGCTSCSLWLERIILCIKTASHFKESGIWKASMRMYEFAALFIC